MAITIESSPTDKSSANDNLWHVVSSSNSATTDFKYVFDIWVNGVQKIRVKQFPEPDTSNGYFDASMVAKNSFSYAWFEPTNNTAFVNQPSVSGDVCVKYQLRIGEEVSGVVTSNMASGETTVCNWVPPLFKRRSFTLVDKLNKWLTNRPLSITAGLTERIYTGFYTDTTLQLKLKAYDSSNTLVTDVSGSVTAVPNGFVQCNIGLAALQTYLGISITDDIKYYDVWFNSLESIRVYADCNPKYDPTLIHFLNKFGIWETLRFDLASRLNMDVQRKGFEKRDYQFNGSAVDYYSTSNRYYEGKINHANVADWIYKLTANAMTDADYEWASELISSPQILMEVDTFFYPVTIKNTSYEYSKFVNNKLRPLEIEFELNQSRQTQLR